MAQSINNVRNIKDAPKKPLSARAAKKAAELEALRVKEDEARGLKGPTVDDDAAAANQSVGANGSDMDAGRFLRWVQKLNAHEDKGEAIKLALKEWRTGRKLLRKEAGGDGITMRELDEALENLKTEQVDLIAREERRKQYHEWLGIPLTVQVEAELSVDDEAQAKARWRRRGLQDGRLGKERKLPEGIPPENGPDYLGGHEEGQMDLMRGSPLTREGFGDKKPARAAAATPDAPGGILVFHEGHFVTGTTLEEANLKTLLGEHHEAFMAADRVVALFGTKRRTLREPDADMPDGFYCDTGDDDVPVSDPEIVAPDAADLA